MTVETFEKNIHGEWWLWGDEGKIGKITSILNSGSSSEGANNVVYSVDVEKSVSYEGLITMTMIQEALEKFAGEKSWARRDAGANFQGGNAELMTSWKLQIDR